MTLGDSLGDLALLATGAVLALTGIAASSMARVDKRPEWHWLATFAFLRATSPWIQLVTLGTGGSQPAKELIASFCEVVAGVALLEFARQSGGRLRGGSTGRWIHLVVLGASLPFALSVNMDPLRTAGALSTLLGGLCAAISLLRTIDPDAGPLLRRLRWASAGSLGLIGLTTAGVALWMHFKGGGQTLPAGLIWLDLGATLAVGSSQVTLYSFLQYTHLARSERESWVRRGGTALGILGAVALGALALTLFTSAPRLPVLLVTLILILLALVSYHAGERIRDEVSQAAQTEHRSRLLIDCSPNATFLFDNRGRCILVNRSARMVFGLTEEETLRRAFADIWPEASRQVVAEAVATSIGGTPSRFDADYVHRDGRRVMLSVATNPAVDADGLVQGFVAVAADVTVRRRKERDLVKAKANAESVAHAKSEFLAVMTHEIRTPLSGVIGHLESLKRLPQPPNQRRQTELALDNADSLLEILDQILDAAKIESAQFSLTPKPFNPAAELSRVTDGQRIRAETAGLELHVHFSADLPRGLIGDGVRLRQVLANLLSNAIKFTKEGHVAVRVGGEPHPGRTHLLRIEVSDTGIGMRPEVQAKLFEAPLHTDFSTNRNFGSSGLGLAIIRTIVGLMGGEIRVASQPDQGTTVTIEVVLPLAEAESLPAVPIAESIPPEPEPALPLLANPSAPSPESGPLKILCAEDNPTNRLVIQLLLEPMGHEIHFAEDGAQAVKKLTEDDFDVVLMDNRMPVMDGFQATRAIRDPQSPVKDREIPVIALTANASKSYRDECIASGMNDYLTKPVREPALRAALNRAARGRSRVPRKAAPPRASEEASPLPLSQASHQDLAPLPAPAPRLPEPAEPAAPPMGMSEDELLALLDEQQQSATASSPADNLTPESRRKLSQQYLSETPRLLNSIRVAWAVHDAVTLARAGHSLKSSSRYVRADKLSDLGGRIEALADRGELAPVAPLIEATDREFSLVSERLLVEVQP